MNLCSAEISKEYIIKGISTGDGELESFLFSLGCYVGESIFVVSRRGGGMVVALKDARYHIDNALGRAIEIYERD